MFGLICLMFGLLLLLVLVLIWVFMGFGLVYRLVFLVGLVGLILLGFLRLFGDWPGLWIVLLAFVFCFWFNSVVYSLLLLDVCFVCV